MAHNRPTGKNIARDKSYILSKKLIKIYEVMRREKEFVLSTQLLRSGTSIGAQIIESEHAESKSDFIHKLSVALKEANETLYWIRLLSDMDHLDEELSMELKNDVSELIRILVASLKTPKGK